MTLGAGYAALMSVEMGVYLLKKLSDHVTLFGNGDCNFYLLEGEKAAVIECGTSAGAAILAQQWQALEQKPAVEYIIMLHSHFDHACGLPILQNLFPRAQVLGSLAAQKILAKERIVKSLYAADEYVTEFYLKNGLLKERPEVKPPAELVIDQLLVDGDTIDLGAGVQIQIIAAPGHSVCSLAAYLDVDQAIFISDAAGYRDDSGEISPVFFYDYDSYMATIERLQTYPAQIIGVAHGQVLVGDDTAGFYPQALASARNAFDEIKGRLQAGQSEDEISEKMFNQYIQGTLAHYPREMMLASMQLLIKNVKAKM